VITLLPPSGSPQEQALADAIDYGINPRVIRGFKFAPTDSVLPWLIWEYGLGEILAWVPDPRQAIQDGVRFQRIRGTPASLRMALKWMNIENIYIEEEPPGKHFAEFQVGIHDVPNDFFVDNVVALAKLSAPARSRLMRMYNDRYDIRRFMLDQSDWGSLLSDYSGVRLTPDGPVLSFGRFNPFEATSSQPILKFSANRQHHNNALSDDLYRLDFAFLGETDPHTRNYNGIYIRDHIGRNLDPLSPFTQDFVPANHWAKALIVLSDSWRLGEINACFAVTTQTEVGATFILSQDQISNHVWHFLYQEILERFYRAQEHIAQAVIDEEIHTFIEKDLHNTYKEAPIWPVLSEEILEPIQLNPFSHSEIFMATMYPGMLTWHQHRHLSRPWTNSDPIVNITLN
jgi:P2-related tail formation protein